MRDVCRMTARAVVGLLERREVTPHDLVEAALERISRVEPAVNAVPTLCPERALARARAIHDGKVPRPEDGRGWLAGLPVVIKDLHEVAGVRTTHGSPIFADHVPTRSGYGVERLEAMGAVIVGKSNTPEFGAGAQTFNEVFGATRNPWDTRLTCSGSSGGSAVALATGEVWLADGSDLGGSLRTPAAFCGVVGFRPSPGRVPHGPAASPFQTLGVEGPMARNVPDVALMLDAMACHDPRDPLTWDPPATSYRDAAERGLRPAKVAFTADLGGITPVDPEVAAICRRAAARLGEVGAVVEETSPDLRAATDVFTILRAEQFVTARAPLLELHRDKLKPEVVWNIEHGLGLTAERIGWAERERGLMQRRMSAFLQAYDVLCCPAAIVPPFPVEQRYVAALGEHRFPSYIDWVTITYAITLTGCPAISIPAGFTATGLPVGLQLVGPPRGEAKLLAIAAVLEDLLGLADAVPIDPRTPG
jgi:amidase